MKFTFKKYRDMGNAENDRTDVVFDVEAENLPEVLEAFKDFLRGCGFSVDLGSLVIDKEEL